MIPDPSPPYEVDASGLFKDRLRRMLRRASELGVRAEIDRSLGEISDLLTQRPRERGDPIKDFRVIHFTQFRGPHKGFVCIYSVHDRIPTVVVTKLIPLEGNPLFGGDYDSDG
jgi:hypothetical protein